MIKISVIYSLTGDNSRSLISLRAHFFKILNVTSYSESTEVETF
jgi:hypothetical protein